MASKLLKQLSASQKFLKGLTTLPNYASVRQKQQDAVSKALACATCLAVAEATAFMEALEEGLWESTWMEGVKVQVSSMVEQDGEGSASRKAMQDYRCLPRYLSQELWAVLLDEQQERAAALERLTHHSAKLGLRHPTEGTLAIMLATVWCVGSQQPSSSQMFELLTQNRLKIKKLLASHPQPPNYLQVLPALVEELPRELLILAFPEGAPAPCSRMDELSGKAAAWPLRKTSRLTGDQGDGSRVAETPGSTVAALGQFMAAMASGFQGATARAPAPVQPRITLLSPPGRTKEPLALQDGPLSSRPAEEVESQPLRPGQPSSIGGQPTQATAAQLGPVMPRRRTQVRKCLILRQFWMACDKTCCRPGSKNRQIPRHTGTRLRKNRRPKQRRAPWR